MQTYDTVDANEIILKKVCSSDVAEESFAFTSFDYLYKRLCTDFEFVMVPKKKEMRKILNFFRLSREKEHSRVSFSIETEHYKTSEGHGVYSYGDYYDERQYMCLKIGDRTLYLYDFSSIDRSGENKVSYTISSKRYDYSNKNQTFNSYESLFNFLVDYIATYTKSFTL